MIEGVYVGVSIVLERMVKVFPLTRTGINFCKIDIFVIMTPSLYVELESSNISRDVGAIIVTPFRDTCCNHESMVKFELLLNFKQALFLSDLDLVLLLREHDLEFEASVDQNYNQRTDA